VDDKGAGGDQPPASKSPVEDAETLSRLVKQVIADELKPIKGDISGLYSRQDKDRKVFGEFLDEFKKQKATGLSDQDAEDAAQLVLTEREKAVRRDKVIDQLAERFLNESPEQIAGNNQNRAVKSAEVFGKIERAMQFDDNDIAAAAVKKAYADDPLTMLSQLAELKVSQANVKPAGPAGALPPSGGQGATRAPELERLQKEYDAQKAKIPRGQTLAFSRLRQEYRQKGLNI
jgi:hypothetical protein